MYTVTITVVLYLIYSASPLLLLNIERVLLIIERVLLIIGVRLGQQWDRTEQSRVRYHGYAELQDV